jgi:hypothetical protein
MKKAIVCTFDTRDQTEAAIRQLTDAGFGTNDISVLMSDAEGTKDFAHEHNTKAPEGAIGGAAAGGVLGGRPRPRHRARRARDPRARGVHRRRADHRRAGRRRRGRHGSAA